MIPQRTLVGGVATALFSEFCGSPVSVVANSFHGAVGEFDSRFGRIRHTHFIQAVLKSHDAHANRTMFEVGVAGFLDSVIVDVDHVVEHAHGSIHGALEFVVVKFRPVCALFKVLNEVDRPQVANSCFSVAGIEGDFGTQVRGVNHANVLLG